LQLLIFNEEFLVKACHQRALITSLPFVHTARRSYRLNDPVRSPDCGNAAGSPAAMPREAAQTLSFRGRRSRNKVSVGEPAEGSLPVFPPARMRTVTCTTGGSAREGRSPLCVCRPGSFFVARLSVSTGCCVAGSGCGVGHAGTGEQQGRRSDGLSTPSCRVFVRQPCA
jgi:hypothetical protein